MMEAKITYFDTPGKENTDAVMKIVKTRAQELGIKTVVVASYRGYTAEKAVRTLEDMKIVVIAGFSHPTPQNLEETFAQGDENLIKSKATILVATHFFSGMSRAMRKKYNSPSPEDIAAQALKIISIGIKVGIECAIMAADAGLVGTDEDIIAIAGTRGGADTAIVTRPVNSQDFFDLKVKEILCKPRNW
ncbi:pyruvate kinase alpha/beta domain-containing protein [Chloroflexota bacterium]